MCFFLICLSPCRRLLLTPGMWMGRKGPIGTKLYSIHHPINRESHQHHFVLFVWPPGRRLLLTPGMEMGGGRTNWGQYLYNHPKEQDIIEYHYAFIYCLYRFVFIHIHLYNEKTSKIIEHMFLFLFCLVTDLFNLAGDGPFGIILGPCYDNCKTILE